MGIYGALSTAVSGLKAQSFALEHISGNIANSQTSGFKRVETNFVDLIPDSPIHHERAGGVLGFSRSTNNVQGDIQISDHETFMAINGDGYFSVSQKVDVVDNRPVFKDTPYFTRRGDFDLDRHGYLVNGAGYYLRGLPVDALTGNVQGSVPDVIQISNDFLPAQKTTEVSLRANLAQSPQTGNFESDDYNTTLLSDLTGFTRGVDTTGPATIQADEESTFVAGSISGGSITMYASNGLPVNLQLRWGKVTSSDDGTNPDTWNLYYKSDSKATGTDPMWSKIDQDYIFDNAGGLDPAFEDVTITNLQINNIALGDIKLIHGATGISQFADSEGIAQITDFTQDGYPAGELVDLSVSDDGRVAINYSNGEIIDVAEVVLASFHADNQLKRLDGGLFAITSESGDPIYGSTGNVQGGKLEASNSDIADEFTKLIITQQAYSANTRVVSTSDEMLQEALNMVR